MDNKPKNRKKKHITKPEYKNMNAFKAAEKHYKLYQGHQTDFSSLYEPEENEFVEVLGYQVCQLPFPQGAYLVKNFTDFQTALEVGLRSLNQFCIRPYRTNLDSREELYQQQKEQKEEIGKRQEIMKKQENIVPQKRESKLVQKQGKGQEKGYYFNEKIRWANVGYQYDWTLRKYPDKKTVMHPLIQNLTQDASKLFNAIEHSDKKYQPETAIINYYGVRDYMTGHLDNAEEDQNSPIYSFSFGLSCIFVIGGLTKQEQPTSVRLDCGDLLIMAGDSRKCYHGVPRVIENSFTRIPKQEGEYEGEEKEGENGWKQVISYFKSHRININIRQVFTNNNN